MAKNVIYLELSQGKPTYNYFQGKHNDSSFLAIEAYKYGTGEQFKTFTSAMKQAQKDFKKEAKHHFNESFKFIGTRNALRITETIDKGILIHNQIEINS